MPRTNDRVKETSTTTGTGDFTLAGAVAQFQSFSAGIVVGNMCQYAIVGQSGTEWETGIGTLTGSSTLRRDKVYQSSNSDALVNFSAGTKDVFATAIGVFLAPASHGRQLAKSRGWDMP